MKIKRRMLEALAGIQNYITHGINTKDCPACPRWDELQISVMEAIAALEAAEAREAELRARVAHLESLIADIATVAGRDVPDAIDNDGQPYQSQALDAVIRATFFAAPKEEA